MSTMYWSDYYMNMGICEAVGAFCALLMLVFLWAKGKPFEGFYQGFLILLLSPLWGLAIIPFAIMSVIKTLKEK